MKILFLIIFLVVSSAYSQTITLTSINPSIGPVSGGIPVTLTGTNLGSTQNVFFNTTASIITSISSNQLIVTLPAMSSSGYATVYASTGIVHSNSITFNYAVATSTPTFTNTLTMTFTRTNTPTATFTNTATPTINATTQTEPVTALGTSAQSIQNWSPISVNQFPYSAYGDGIHDDHGAIQAAFNAAASIGYTGGKVVFGSKATYLVNEPITITTSSGTNNSIGQYSLCADLNKSTIVGGSGVSQIFYIYSPNTSTTWANGIIIQNGTLNMSNMPTGSTSAGILVENSYNDALRDMYIVGDASNKPGLNIGNNCYTWTVDNLNCGFVTVGGQSGNDDSTITFSNLNAQQVSMAYVFGSSFIKPVLQGSVNKFVFYTCTQTTIIGGDYEGSGYLFDFADSGSWGINEFGMNVASGVTFSTGPVNTCYLPDRVSPQGCYAKAYGEPNISYAAGVTTGTIYTFTDSTSPTSKSGGLFLIYGDNGLNGFQDVIDFAFGNIVVISSASAYSSPPARTYSYSSGSIILNLASNSSGYNVRVALLESMQR